MDRIRITPLYCQILYPKNISFSSQLKLSSRVNSFFFKYFINTNVLRVFVNFFFFLFNLKIDLIDVINKYY